MIVLDGRLTGFRFRDPFDFQAINQAIDTSGGGPSYQLRKAYTFGGVVRYRVIRKPVAGTVSVFLNSSPVTLTPIGSLSPSGDTWGEPLWNEPGLITAGVTIDYTNGQLRWYDQPFPTVGDVLTWTGEFDVPVRIDTDDPRFRTVNFESFRLESLPIIEERQ